MSTMHSKVNCKKGHDKKRRKPNQIKRIHKGMKSLRGQPEDYDQLKQRVTICITPSAREGLDHLSSLRAISRSELIERIGRQILKIVDAELFQE